MYTFVGRKVSDFSFKTSENVEIVFNEKLPLCKGVMYVIHCEEVNGGFEYIQAKIVDLFKGSTNLRRLVEE